MSFLKDRSKALLAYLADFLPLQRRTVYNPRVMPGSLAATLNVDLVHEIITSAEQGDTERLFALYQDILVTGSHLQGRLGDRKEAVLSDTLSVQPFDKNNADDVAAAELIKLELTKHDDWEDTCAHLLDSVLWPVSLVEKTYQPSTKPGLRYELKSLTPVPYQLLTYIEGRMELRETDDRGHPTTVRFAPEPARYLMHRGHLLKGVPDNWGGPMRSLVFWWLLSHMSRDWWARFLDRYGAPFVVGRYDQNDDASRSILERAFALATKLGGLVISKETEVEIKQAAASDSGEAYQAFIELCNRETSKLILGETLSSDAQATGMGSGTAKSQGSKRDEKRMGDARRLAKTLRNGLFKQFLEINGLKGRPPVPIWGSVSPEEIASICDTLDSLTGAGLEVDDSALVILSEKVGFQLRRSERPPPVATGPGGVLPFSAASLALKKKADDAVDLIAEAAAVDLAAAFPGELAPIRGIILASSTPEEAIRDVLAFCAKFEPGKSARVIEEALVAMAANGCVAHAR
ncbi:phage portal protein family protein [Horticoccus sp. 23ND18S-11]|uniref:phage portal protein family protein n=1 Tax=Horticoccus sp. 23ND18S-11 TaxID=3391832 RepID=UPI0039C92EA2